LDIHKGAKRRDIGHNAGNNHTGYKITDFMNVLVKGECLEGLSWIPARPQAHPEMQKPGELVISTRKDQPTKKYVLM